MRPWIQQTHLRPRQRGRRPITRHPPGEDNTSPGLPESLSHRFLLLRFGFFHLGGGLRFSGTGARRIPPETSHKSVPPLLPEAWNAFGSCARRSHSFPSIWSLLNANRLEDSCAFHANRINVQKQWTIGSAGSFA